MKNFKHFLLLGITALMLSCGTKEDDNPNPHTSPTNDNSKIEGDWIEKYQLHTAYDSLGQYVWQSRSHSTNYNQRFIFKSEGNFEEGFINSGQFNSVRQGTFNLKSNILTISLTGGLPPDFPGIHTGVYYIDTLTTTKLTFLDTIGNFTNDPRVKYGILKTSLYR